MRPQSDLLSVVDAALARAPAADRSWRVAEELGWTRVGIAEASGGYGGDLADALAVMEGAGRHAVGIPLLESLLANTILGWVGLLRDDDRPACVLFGGSDIHAAGHDGDRGLRLTGAVAGISVPPTAMRCVLVGTIDEPNGVYLLDDLSDVQRIPTRGGDPSDDRCTVRFDAARVDEAKVAVLTRGALDVTAHWALFRAAWVLGTVERVIELTVEHVRVRKQFGRPLASFQAVQHQLARMVCERNLLRAAVSLALTRHAAAEPAYAARLTAAQASEVVSTSAHQLLGAMGITQEHQLHVFTTSLRRLRDDLHGHRWWREALGTRLTDLDEQGIWTVITTGGQP
jgi:acyl-CoA dehydrogenase